MSREFEVEVCEICGNVSEELVEINGSSVCKNCAEELGLERNNFLPSNFCVICGWSINREVDERTLRGFLKVIRRWLKRHKAIKVLKVIKKLRFKESLSICRYDFFELISKIIERYSKRLAKKFRKEFVRTYDFKGSLIS